MNQKLMHLMRAIHYVFVLRKFETSLSKKLSFIFRINLFQIKGYENYFWNANLYDISVKKKKTILTHYRDRAQKRVKEICVDVDD